MISVYVVTCEYIYCHAVIYHFHAVIYLSMTCASSVLGLSYQRIQRIKSPPFAVDTSLLLQRVNVFLDLQLSVSITVLD